MKLFLYFVSYFSDKSTLYTFTILIPKNKNEQRNYKQKYRLFCVVQ